MVACAMTARLVWELLPLRLDVLHGQRLQSIRHNNGKIAGVQAMQRHPPGTRLHAASGSTACTKTSKPEKAADSMVRHSPLSGHEH